MLDPGWTPAAGYSHAAGILAALEAAEKKQGADAGAIAGALLELEPDDRHREQKRALRIAYAHARRGQDAGADLWLALAAELAPVAPEARQRVERLLRTCATRPLPGQLDLVEELGDDF